MQAIILAAGMGKRLGELTKENTKCMIKVHSRTLIERMLTQLTALPDMKKVIMVIGYEGKKVQQLLGTSFNNVAIEYVENKVYDKTNNIYSLYLAKDHLLNDHTLLLESDLIFSDEILTNLINDPYPNLAVVSKYQSWMDGTVVTLDKDNNILNFITKKAFNFDHKDTYYKTVNMYKFSREFSTSYYVPFLDAYCKALGNSEYYEQVLRVITLLDKSEIKAMPLNGEKWYEIDDAQDLNNAEAIFAEPDIRLSLYQKRYGGYWRFPFLCDFCYLVNPFFPSEKLRKEMKANFDTLLSEYPSGMEVNSLLMAKYFGLNHAYVCVGNGAAELIKSLMEQLNGPMGVMLPTFEEYPNRKDKQEVIPFIPSNPDFTYTADDIIAFFTDKAIATLLLVNPDNPSGNFIPRQDIFRLLQWAEEKGIRLVLDESFVDFSEGSWRNTLLDNAVLAKHPRLVVIKSISKSYGVPGLRLGILASGDRALVGRIRKDVPIWNINSFAEFYMQIFGKYEADYREACGQFIAERNFFYRELQAIGFLRVIPSQANYFLCEVTSTYTSAQLTERLLNQFNILIKDCGTKAAFQSSNYIRIAVKSRQDNLLLINALKQL